MRLSFPCEMLKDPESGQVILECKIRPHLLLEIALKQPKRKCTQCCLTALQIMLAKEKSSQLQ